MEDMFTMEQYRTTPHHKTARTTRIILKMYSKIPTAKEPTGLPLAKYPSDTRAMVTHILPSLVLYRDLTGKRIFPELRRCVFRRATVCIYTVIAIWSNEFLSMLSLNPRGRCSKYMSTTVFCILIDNSRNAVQTVTFGKTTSAIDNLVHWRPYAQEVFIVWHG